MNEINKTLHKHPQPCKHCDWHPPARKNYQTGEIYYPSIPGGLCDSCYDAQLASLIRLQNKTRNQ